MNGSELVIAVTTFSQQDAATQMAQRVIRARVAACAQVEGPIESYYHWNGEEHHDTEWRLTMKTTAAAETRLRQLVHKHHPYELPQWSVVALLTTTEAYANWVRSTVAETGLDAD